MDQVTDKDCDLNRKPSSLIVQVKPRNPGYCLLVLRSRGARAARGARRARGAREARGARGAREARQARGAGGARAGSMNPFCFLHCIWSSSTNSSV